jgi:hypothetical protein
MRRDPRGRCFAAVILFRGCGLGPAKFRDASRVAGRLHVQYRYQIVDDYGGHVEEDKRRSVVVESGVRFL